MENCTIYSHYLDVDKIVQIVKTHLPKAELSLQKTDADKIIKATVKGGLFGKDKILTIRHRQRLKPSYQLDKIECPVTQNLSGMVNFIQSIPSQNELVRQKFLVKVMAMNAEMPFVVETGWIPEFETIFKELMQELDAFAFANPSSFFNQSDTQYFLDKDMKVILDMNGKCQLDDLEVNISTSYFDPPAETYTQEQLDRKVQIEAFLAQKHITINSNLPCTPSVSEVKMRSKQEIIDRAYGLLVVSAKGEGIEQVHIDKVVLEKRINSLSPYEKHIFEAQELTDQDRINSSWRYEALNVLLWALGVVPDLTYPSDMCDVGGIVGKMLEPTREAFEGTIKLKSTEDVLSELDKTYRMHWACVDARLKGKPNSGNLHAGVIYERHYALNWLTQFQNPDCDWDDIETPT